MSTSKVTRKLPQLDGIHKADTEPEVGHIHKQSQANIERCLGQLGSLSSRLSCVLAQRELESPAMHRLGFATVQVAGALTSAITEADAVLVVSVGSSPVVAQRAVEAVGQFKDSPTILVIVIAAPSPEDGKVDPERGVALATRSSQLRRALFEAGADDVMCFHGGEAVQPARVIESIEKSEYMAAKMSDIINGEVKEVELKAARKLQQAHKKFLMMLPGRVFENIPYEDEQLAEERLEDGSLAEVGPCTFEAKLGSGAFGSVYRARHPKFGTCAVKIVSKKTVKNASILFSLDRELCQLMYANPHPNIIQAHEVLHGQHNFYIVMQYAGQLHLQKYTKTALEQSGEQTLPVEVIRSFCGQQAAAMSHLHSSMVCHRDLKPDNWIVSDDGMTLQLADFGLAMQLSGPAHPLHQSCGSLPFCAPEVFDAESPERQHQGYDGLAADVWSLGVNYLELVCGPYSIEKVLGWLPQHPEDHDVILEGLESLEAWWGKMAHQDHAGVGHVISKMLVLHPPHRWKIGQVSGSQGLGLPRQPQAPRGGAHYPRRPQVGCGSPTLAG